MSAFKKPSVIINLTSGSTSDISDNIVQVFAEHNLPEPNIHAVEAKQLQNAFHTLAKDKTDLLVIYGGDGTCKSGAIVARDLDIPLIALPGGTMNMLPIALYGTDDWREALSLALQQDGARWFPAGRVNEELFFCGAIIGDPIKMSEARESVRDGDIAKAIKKLPDVVSAITEGDTFSYMADGKSYVRDANLLHLSAPKSSEGRELRFELASVPNMTVSDLLDVGARTLIAGWRESEHVHVDEVETVTIDGQGAFDVLLDGETTRVTCPVKISLKAQGVKVLAPRNKGNASAFRF